MITLCKCIVTRVSYRILKQRGEMRKMLLKKGQLLFQYPAMDTKSCNYYLKGGGYPPFPPV